MYRIGVTGDNNMLMYGDKAVLFKDGVILCHTSHCATRALPSMLQVPLCLRVHCHAIGQDYTMQRGGLVGCYQGPPTKCTFSLIRAP